MSVHGELIDRLVALLSGPEDGDPFWWSELGHMTTFLLGGSELTSVVPDTGSDPVPGSVGAEERRRSRVVDKHEYFALIGSRLRSLVAGGVKEMFLVRAVRDELARHVSWLADVAATEEPRARTQEAMLDRSDDPAEIARLRAFLIEQEHDPTAQDLTDEDLSERLRVMAATPSLAPTTPEQATQRWETKAQWDRLVEVVSDEVIEEWVRLLRF